MSDVAKRAQQVGHLCNTSKTLVGKVAKALCSMSFMTSLSTITDTGKPIAVPYVSVKRPSDC